MISRQKFATYGRNIVFGAEDGLVSTVGLLSGVATAKVDEGTIFLTGVILILVEAFSMAVGSFLSESESEEYMSKKKVKETTPFIASLAMFFSYLFAGLIPLFPYMIFGMPEAIGISIVGTLVALLFLGVFSAIMFKINIVRRSLQTVFMGSAAIALGVLVGKII